MGQTSTWFQTETKKFKFFTDPVVDNFCDASLRRKVRDTFFNYLKVR